MDWSVLVSERPIAFPWEPSEFEWPFWLVVLLTAWLVWRALASCFRQPGILPSLSTMMNWPRVLLLLCLTVSAACVAAVVLQLPSDWLGIYRGYHWTDTRRKTLLATVLFGFGPLLIFLALYGPSRWIIRRKARNRTEPIGNIVAQTPRDEAKGAVQA